jgi:hypothetical protein
VVVESESEEELEVALEVALETEVALAPESPLQTTRFG